MRDFEFSPDFAAGSHVTYRHPSGVRITVAVHGSRVPAYTVKQALKAIDSVIAAEVETGENDDE